ncbi:MAG: TonB-dependent receptor, partial [Deltaproteobacteria bacterium]
VDHQDYIGTNYSPRGSLIYTPLKGHIICFSAGGAFRNPAYIDLFTDLSLAGTVIAKGRRDLKPESIISVELGYRASFIERLRANLGVFYNKIEDLIRTFGDYEDFPIRSINYNGAEAIGGEVGLEYKITPWLSGLINYSYQEITYRELPSQELIYQDGEPIESNPKNKLNGGFRVTLKNGFSANILVHYVDTTKREYPIIEELVPDWPLKRLDPYTLLTARISYKLLDDRFEVALAGQNLLNDVHKGVPIIGEEIPLRVYGTLSARF